MRGGIESKSHLIAWLRIILEDQIHKSPCGIQRDLSSLVCLLHLLWIRRHVLAEEDLYVSHVVLHLFFFLGNDSLLHSSTARFRWNTDRSFLHLAIRSVLTQVLRCRLRIALQRELHRFSPLILVKPLRICRGDLLYGSNFFLKFAVLCDYGCNRKQRSSSCDQQSFTDRRHYAGPRLFPVSNYGFSNHLNSPLCELKLFEKCSANFIHSLMEWVRRDRRSR